MINLLLFLIHLALFAWAFGAVGNYTPAPTLIFVAFGAAIVAGYCALRMVTRALEILLLEADESARSAGRPLRPASGDVLRRVYAYQIKVESVCRPKIACVLPKSCWF